MKAQNVTRQNLIDAMAIINRTYGNNITWKRDPEPANRAGTSYDFTITVKDSSGPGARRSDTGRKIAAACWHAHGDLFDAILKIAPDAIIKTNGMGGNTISAAGGNWEDRNIGSLYRPLYASEACECGK